ncbi:MAG: hypothetical protein RR144_00690, partial [Clostridia bacterium]
MLNDEIGANPYDVTNIDKTNPTIPTDITITNNINSIVVQALGSTDSQSGIIGYEYSINNGTTWTSAKTATHEFTGIKAGTNVVVKTRAKDKVANYSVVKEKNTSTTNISGKVSVSPNTSEWTKNNVTITISHANIPVGYELQYKIGSGNWLKYTS